MQYVHHQYVGIVYQFANSLSHSMKHRTIGMCFRGYQAQVILYTSITFRGCLEYGMNNVYIPIIINGENKRMFSLIGAHWIPVHNRESDYKFIHDLGAPMNKIVGGPLDVSQVSRMYAESPESKIMFRDHPLSEQKGDMAVNPIATGKRHAEEMMGHYYRMHKEAKDRNLPYPSKEQVVLIGINEPNLDAGDRRHMDYKVWLEETERLATVVDNYNVAFLDTLSQHGFIGGAMNLSVGWPTNIIDDEPSYWGWFDNTLAAIKRGNHYLVVHEYWSHAGLDYMYGWWAGRVTEQCPWDVPIIIGEAGIDQYVADGSVSKTSRGWTGRPQPNKKVLTIAEMIEYNKRCVERDPRIKAIFFFTSDCNHSDWGSFDLEPLYADFINAIRILDTGPTPIDTFNIKYVNAPAGLNIRSGPGLDFDVVNGLKHGDPVKVFGYANGKFGESWAQVGDREWASTAFLLDEKPLITKPKHPYEINEPDAITIINGLARMFKLDKYLLYAILSVESSAEFVGYNNLPYIRFENHVFRDNLKDDALFNTYFKYGTPSHTGHMWRMHKDGKWETQHQLGQENEWEVFNFAKTLNEDAAIKSISIGIGQIMGFHYEKLGYNSPKEMLQDMIDNPVIAQTMSFFSYLYNKKGMMDAIRAHDFVRIAELYNGLGNVPTYAALITDAYTRLKSSN